MQAYAERFTLQHDRIIGIIAVLFYGIHGGVLLYRHEPEHLLWSCHIATLLIGGSLILRVPLWNGIGFLWLVMGDFFWMLYLLGGGEFMPTSILTHIGGLIIGSYGILRLGVRRYSWIGALIALPVLQQISRQLTPERANINLAFKIHPGWEEVFPGYVVYMITLLVFSGIVFFLIERLLRRNLETKE